MATERKTTLGSIEKSFRIIDCLVELDNAGLTELARETSIHKSTVHAHLRTLEKLGYVVNEDGNYALSLKFLQVGGEVRENLEVYRKGRSSVQELAEETGELANLGVEQAGKLNVIHMREGKNAEHDREPEGKQTYMHCTAMGKALLAHCPDPRVETILESQGLPELTKHTITSRERLSAELEKIRKEGYAIDDEEANIGIRCIAAPILNDENRPYGAISVTGPAKRLGEEGYQNEIIQSVLNTANVIEVEMRFG